MKLKVKVTAGSDVLKKHLLAAYLKRFTADPSGHYVLRVMVTAGSNDREKHLSDVYSQSFLVNVIKSSKGLSLVNPWSLKI